MAGLAVLATLAIVTGWLWWAYHRTVDALQSSAAELSKASSGQIDSDTLLALLAKGDDAVDRARSASLPFRWLEALGARHLPLAGQRLRTMRAALDVGGEALRAGDLLVQQQAADWPSRSRPFLVGNRFEIDFLNGLSARREQLREGLHRAEQAQTLLRKARLSGDLPEEAGYSLDRLELAIQRLVALGHLEATLADAGTWLFGMDAPRRFLLLAQNPDELRGSGGLIPGAWSLTLASGEIQELLFLDTLEVDDPAKPYPIPPSGLLVSMWAGAWFFRDATWSPHFPDAAETADRLFQIGKGASFDGVVAIDQFAIAKIVQALGGITLPSRGALTDEAELLRTLETGTDQEGHRFMDEVLTAMLDRLRSGESDVAAFSLLVTIGQSFEQKHLLGHFKQPQVQTAFERIGWAGSIMTPQEGDFLMVVDSNVGFNKVNPNIEKRISYRVSLEESQHPWAQVSIQYRNRSRTQGQTCIQQLPTTPAASYAEAKEDCYWNYLRLYVPGGSKLEGATPLPMPEGALYRRIGYNDRDSTLTRYEEYGKSVFAGLFVVPPGAQRDIVFSYRPPPLSRSVGDGQTEYTLYLLKQPGTLEVPVTAQITFPKEHRLVRAVPSPVAVDPNTARFSLALDRDSQITLVLERK